MDPAEQAPTKPPLKLGEGVSSWAPVQATPSPQALGYSLFYRKQPGLPNDFR
jgi:hypothetical protein